MLGYAIPALARLINQECGITLGSWLVLLEIEQRGKPSADGPLVLRHELTKLFDKRGFTRPNISKILNGLFQKKLILRTTLTIEERNDLFGLSSGPCQAVVLTSAGSQKIEEFKTALRLKFVHWQAQQPPMVRVALKGFTLTAVKLLRALGKEAHSDATDN